MIYRYSTDISWTLCTVCCSAFKKRRVCLKGNHMVVFWSKIFNIWPDLVDPWLFAESWSRLFLISHPRPSSSHILYQLFSNCTFYMGFGTMIIAISSSWMWGKVMISVILGVDLCRTRRGGGSISWHSSDTINYRNIPNLALTKGSEQP